MDYAGFKAAMFDYDGTITEKGVNNPSEEMILGLVNLARKMPIAVCTGRQWESFEERCLRPLLASIPRTEQLNFLKNFYLIAENGSIGYHFNSELGDFEEFYRVKWPSEFIEKEEFREIVLDNIAEFGKAYDSNVRHKVIEVFVRNSDDHADIEKVYKNSERIFEAVTGVLRSIGPNFHDFLHVGNAGIAVTVCPANGDKDSGIRRFGEYLSEKFGLMMEDNFKEILIIGDQGQEGGNDFYFLSGRFGTPFSVGGIAEQSNFVVDDNGERLLNSHGTYELIKRLL